MDIKHDKSNILKGKVSGIKNYGIFVNLENDTTGMIHISEVSHNFVRNIEDFVKVGDPIFVEVIDNEESDGRYKLSIKNINFKSGGKNHIEENGEGFKMLDENLEKWTLKKLEEIRKNK